ncbi:uncharacterized protein LOC133799907 [Humulus lupulus]|uniref:uncharacterized protein LOC133799907 n=1 Tax=Humulus lupulus TaxID=3486 RepID=UPI002B40A4EA|nr:uncharacterized protein LOC133799907 [Humulus lupulus]
MNVITGGSEVSRVIHSAAKRHARKTNWIKGESSRTEKNIINLPAQTISFSTTESTKLLNLHHDALVITLYIARCLTKHILIDNGSSANILFLSALREMGIDESKIIKKTTILISFSGEQKNTLREIVVPVYAEGVNPCTRFLVVDSPSAYNVILGRPWIHEMEAVPSTYHQVLRFPTKWGVTEIKVQQKDSNMSGIDPEVIVHKLQVDPDYPPRKQKRRKFTPERNKAINKEVQKLIDNGFVREVHYLD